LQEYKKKNGRGEIIFWYLANADQICNRQIPLLVRQTKLIQTLVASEQQNPDHNNNAKDSAD
jgi:hypothetical protein